MEDNFKKGVVIKLSEDDDKKYIIIENINYNNDSYLILNPFDEDIDLKNMLLVKIKDDFDFEFVKDLNLANEIVKLALKN